MTKPKPGDFSASCRMGARLPVDVLTFEERAQAEAESDRRRTAGLYDDVFKYDVRAKVETVLIPCALDTTDRAEYLAHMERYHGRKPSTWEASKMTGNGYLARRARSAWKPPKLTAKGTPWIDKEGRTRACRGCGFVVELGIGSTALIEAHKGTCAERGAA